MNICTITCHRVYNYGASLQAFALQYYLEELGHNVKIINFLPPFYFKYDIFDIPKQSTFYKVIKIIPILRYILGPITNRAMVRSYARKKAFDIFENKYLKLTEKSYHTSEELKKDPPNADAYICGSDQIWSPYFMNGAEPAFYLDFGSSLKKRISYAASFGATKLPEERKEFVKHEVSRIDCVSVREENGIDILRELGVDAIRVLDPVFLLSKQEWTKLSSTCRITNFRDYILLYDFIGDSEIGNFAKRMSKDTGLPIVAINDLERNRFAHTNIDNAGPFDFVKMIADASIIISNSFHATAFAIIMEKEFYSFPINSQKSSTRIQSMCKLVGLEDRFSPQSIKNTPIDYINVKNKLAAEIELSKCFIVNSLRP